MQDLIKEYYSKKAWFVHMKREKRLCSQVSMRTNSPHIPALPSWRWAHCRPAVPSPPPAVWGGRPCHPVPSWTPVCPILRFSLWHPWNNFQICFYWLFSLHKKEKIMAKGRNSEKTFNRVTLRGFIFWCVIVFKSWVNAPIMQRTGRNVRVLSTTPIYALGSAYHFYSINYHVID